MPAEHSGQNQITLFGVAVVCGAVHQSGHL